MKIFISFTFIFFFFFYNLSFGQEKLNASSFLISYLKQQSGYSGLRLKAQLIHQSERKKKEYHFTLWKKETSGLLQDDIRIDLHEDEKLIFNLFYRPKISSELSIYLPIWKKTIQTPWVHFLSQPFYQTLFYFDDFLMGIQGQEKIHFLTPITKKGKIYQRIQMDIADRKSFKILSFEKKNQILDQIEEFNFEGKLIRKIEFRNYQKINSSFWQAFEIQVSSADLNEISILKIQNLETDLNLSEDFFIPNK